MVSWLVFIQGGVSAPHLASRFVLAGLVASIPTWSGFLMEILVVACVTGPSYRIRHGRHAVVVCSRRCVLRRSACSVACDCSNVVSPYFEGLFSTSADAGSPWLLLNSLPTAADQTMAVSGGAGRSVALPRHSGGSNPSAVASWRWSTPPLSPLSSLLRRHAMHGCRLRRRGDGLDRPHLLSSPHALPRRRTGVPRLRLLPGQANTPASRSPRNCTQDHVGASEDLSSLDSNQ